jgi:hypothetical protein
MNPAMVLDVGSGAVLFPMEEQAPLARGREAAKPAPKSAVPAMKYFILSGKGISEGKGMVLILTRLKVKGGGIAREDYL